MKKIMFSFATVLLFTLASFAQSSADPNQSQGTQSASPSMQQPDAQSSAGMNGTANTNSEKKIRGCIAQQNGQYVLETKRGKAIPLSGQDVSAHVGHTVALHGTWASSSAGTATATGSTSAEQSFDVTKVDMISESCAQAGSAGSGTATPTTPQQ